MYIQGIDSTKLYDNSAGDVPEFDPGQLGIDANGNIFQFVQVLSSSVALGSVVEINENYAASNLSTTRSAPGTGQGMPAGVVTVAGEQNDWMWVQVKGVNAALNVGTSCAQHTELNSTGTSGRVDDDGSAGAEVINGIVTTGSESGNAAAAMLHWPFIGRTL